MVRFSKSELEAFMEYHSNEYLFDFRMMYFPTRP
jgi:hypothetical protein